MNPKKRAFALWLFFTEVPGWPDAPRGVRIRRTLPIMIPLALALILVGLRIAVAGPLTAKDLAAHAPLLALEKEISTLQLGSSEHDAHILKERADELSSRAIGGPGDAPEVLDGWANEARDARWEAAFHPASACVGSAPGAAIAYLPVTATLVPAPENPKPFPSLLSFLDRLGESKKRVDLTRLSVHAGEDGRMAATMDLRLACRLAP